MTSIMKTTPFVCICTPIWDTIEPPTQRALRALRVPGGWRAAIIDVHGVEVDQARRMLTEQALLIKDVVKGVEETQVTHVLMVDADMVFRSDYCLRLTAHDVDIVSGLCFERRAPYNPVIFRDGKPLLKYPPDELIEVDSCGAAFLLVKRNVFEKLEELEPGHHWWDRHTGLSEDEAFISRVKAAGYKVYADTGCKIGHIGKVVINEDFAKKNGSLGGFYSVPTL